MLPAGRGRKTAIAEAHATRGPIRLISSRAVARLVPPPPAIEPKRLGALKGLLTIPEDFDEPCIEIIDAMEGPPTRRSEAPLDTHVLLWALDDDTRLGPKARALIGDVGNDVLVSVASLWEIAIKNRLGRLPDDLPTILAGVWAAGFHVLPIEIRHLTALGTIPIHHRDPVDHLLLAQAATDELTLMTVDRQLEPYGVRLATGNR